MNVCVGVVPCLFQDCMNMSSLASLMLELSDKSGVLPRAPAVRPTINAESCFAWATCCKYLHQMLTVKSASIQTCIANQPDYSILSQILLSHMALQLRWKVANGKPPSFCWLACQQRWCQWQLWPWQRQSVPVKSVSNGPWRYRFSLRQRRRCSWMSCRILAAAFANYWRGCQISVGQTCSFIWYHLIVCNILIINHNHRPFIRFLHTLLPVIAGVPSLVLKHVFFPPSGILFPVQQVLT